MIGVYEQACRRCLKAAGHNSPGDVEIIGVMPFRPAEGDLAQTGDNLVWLHFRDQRGRIDAYLVPTSMFLTALLKVGSERGVEPLEDTPEPARA